VHLTPPSPKETPWISSHVLALVAPSMCLVVAISYIYTPHGVGATLSLFHDAIVPEHSDIGLSVMLAAGLIMLG
jgi:hypothetical protein